MNAHDRQSVEAYYNERVAGKLRDFTEPNPRIEAAIHLVAEWAPPAPKRILEIGCGIGATSWRMARAWPNAEVIGADISPRSVEVANCCFSAPNLRYRAGLVTADAFEGKFDLILMMDVYEHIHPSDRPALHAAIRRLLADESRFVITVPTPALQAAAKCVPGGLQPVDESITLNDIGALASEIEAELLYFRRVGIWEYGDYDHIVFGRYESLAKVGLREPRPGGLRQRLKSLLRIGGVGSAARLHYLGSDVAQANARYLARRFVVSTAERMQLAQAWLGRGQA